MLYLNPIQHRFVVPLQVPLGHRDTVEFRNHTPHVRASSRNIASGVLAGCRSRVLDTHSSRTHRRSSGRSERWKFSINYNGSQRLAHYDQLANGPAVRKWRNWQTR